VKAVRVSKAKAEQNRRDLLDAAGKLFREKGIPSTGVAEVAAEAGLTHGALYKHFDNKDALAAAAFTQAATDVIQRIREWKDEHDPSYEDYLDILISTRVRDNMAGGCPMIASASEIGRQPAAVGDSFAAAFTDLVSLIESSLPDTVSDNARRTLATATAAAQLGAVAVARAVAKSDDALSQEVLDATRATLADAVPD